MLHVLLHGEQSYLSHPTNNKLLLLESPGLLQKSSKQANRSIHRTAKAAADAQREPLRDFEQGI